MLWMGHVGCASCGERQRGTDVGEDPVPEFAGYLIVRLLRVTPSVIRIDRRVNISG